MMLAAITLLPAFIGLVGKRIDRWQVPSLIHHRDRAAAARPIAEAFWARWATTRRRARVAVRHRWRGDPAVLAWPVLSMRLGESDDGNLPTSTTQRQAYDLIAEGFGPGTNGPLLVVVQLPDSGDAGAHRASHGAREDTRASQRSLPPQLNPAGNTVAVIGVLPTTAPDSAGDRRPRRRRCAATCSRTARRHAAARRPTSVGSPRRSSTSATASATGSPTSSARSCCCRSSC